MGHVPRTRQHMSNAFDTPRGESLPPWQLMPGLVAALHCDARPDHLSPALRQALHLADRGLPDAAWLDALGDGARAAMLELLARRCDFTLTLALRDDVADPRWLDCAAHWLPGPGLYLCHFHDVTTGKLAELSARAQAEQLRLLADNVPVLIAFFRTHDSRCLFANRQYAQTFGWNENDVVGRTFMELIGEAATAQIQPYVDRVLARREVVSYERQLRQADGSDHWIEVNLVPHLDDSGEQIATFVLISDITRHRLAERAVRESEDRLNKFMQASLEGIVFLKDGRVTDANPPVCALLGYTLDEVRGRHALEFVAPDHAEQATQVMKEERETTYESVLLDRHGQRIDVEFITRSMMHNGERLRMTIVRDIRDRRAAQAHIQHLAHHDALTGLPNRMSFMAELDRRMAQARTTNESLALLFVDLDHFKRINDSLGHLAGDTLLRTVAERLLQCLRGTDRVARFGGDEFMVLLPHAPHRSDVEDVARKLLQAIEVPIELEGRLISVTPSVGIAFFPGDAATPAELIKHADSAMYLAKARGRANCQFFDPARVHAAYAALTTESELSQAAPRGQLVLHYQPQVRASDARVVGTEALIRWQHPVRGLLQPDDFLPAAEQQRLMLQIGSWVLREALHHARQWRDSGVANWPVAVNVSMVEFQSSGFVDSIADALRHAGVDGHLLELELSERMLMDDLPAVRRKLERLKHLGVRLSVDDFGTGYFSLRHLRELPIDRIKIDRSFVTDLPEGRSAEAIARAIIQMAHSLGLAVIAEGVETQAQFEILASLGCNEVQGRWTGAPMPAADFEAWLQRAPACSPPPTAPAEPG